MTNFELYNFLFILFIIGFIVAVIGFARAAILTRRRLRLSKGILLRAGRALHQNPHREMEAATRRAVREMNDQAQQMSTHMQQEANHQTLLHTVMQHDRDTHHNQ